MNCTSCNSQIEEARLEAVPDTTVCICCARKGIGQKPSVRGVMVFGHKTGGSIQILSQETYKEWKKYNPYGRYTGRGSGVHRMTKSTSCY